MFKVLVGENEMLPTVESVGERPGSKVPVKVTLLKDPTPLIHPPSVIGCAGELPCTVPLTVARWASALAELIVPNPVTAPPKSMTNPLVAFSVPEFAPAPNVVRLPNVAGPVLFNVTANCLVRNWPAKLNPAGDAESPRLSAPSASMTEPRSPVTWALTAPCPNKFEPVANATPLSA